MKKTLLNIALLSCACTLNAQRLSTTTDVIDVGQVLFRSPVTATFDVKNKSSRNVVIEDIETSCGCTTATSSSTSVGGGKSIIVKATYDAATLGHFNKQILLHEEGQEKSLMLTIKGVVVDELEDYSGTYPCQIGQIYTDMNFIEFENANRGQLLSQEMHILNSTGETIQPVLMHLPPYLTADVSPTRIPDKKGGVITLTLNTDKIRDNGLSQTIVYLGKYPGDKVSAEKGIPVSVVLLPSFNGITEAQYEFTPNIVLSANTISMSKMSGKPEKLKGEILIQNTGRTTLEISALQMFTTGMQVSLNKQKIEPNETVKLKIQVDSKEVKKLKTRPRILMITNDPKNPKVIIEITE